MVKKRFSCCLGSISPSETLYRLTRQNTYLRAYISVNDDFTLIANGNVTFIMRTIQPGTRNCATGDKLTTDKTATPSNLQQKNQRKHEFLRPKLQDLLNVRTM